MTDFEQVRQALTDYRNLCQSFRHGGLGRELPKIEAALEALARIERPPLFQWKARDVDITNVKNGQKA